MIARMDRVEMVFLRSEMSDMIPFLQEQGVLHLENVPLAMESNPGFLHRVNLEEADAVEKEALEAISAVLKESLPLLSVNPIPPQIAQAGPALTGKSRESWMEQARAWHRDLRDLVRQRAELEDQADVLRHYQGVMQTLTPVLLERNVRLGETARALVLDGYSTAAAEELERKIVAEAGPQCDMSCHVSGRKMVAVVCFPEGKGDAVGAVLEKQGIAAVSPPSAEVKGASISEVNMKIARKVAALEVEIETLSANIKRYSELNGPAMLALQQLLANRMSQFAVVDHFAQSRMVGVVHGWVPREDFDALKTSLKTKFGDRVEVGKLPIKDVSLHSIPTKLSNPGIFKPFEMILSLFSPATYGGIDPTKIVGIAFILFYGSILGDVGYGLVVLAVAFWAGKKYSYNPFIKDAMTIAKWMGASSIVFGILFWEFFGNFSEYLIPFPGVFPFFHRAHETNTYLMMAIAVGACYIPLGLLLGVYEGFHHGHTKHAIEKLGMLLGLLSVGLFVLTGSALPALIVFAAAVALLVYSMGIMFVMGVIEIIGVTANVLSFARLMALGMVGIALAEIANQLPGSLGPVIGIPAAILVHLANIGIGVFSPTIHSLRLNYVEFLPKFYETEGKNYQPFRKEVAW